VDKCTGCGCECKFRIAKISPAIVINSPVERLCTVCTELWNAVASRPFFVEAEREFIVDNKFMAAYKAALLGKVEPPKEGFAK
jgi:hypothetical protein